MAYKFQLGTARLSGSLIQEGDVDNTGNISAGGDISSAGNISIVNNGTIGAGADADMIELRSGDGKINIASDVDFNVAKAGGLQIAGTAVTSTAAELNLVDGSSAGTIVNSKAVIYGSSGEVKGTSLSSSADLEVGGNITAAGNLDVIGDITGSGIALNDASGIAGTGLGDSAGQLILDISSLSTVAPANGDKILMLDSDGSTQQISDLSDVATLFAGTGLSATNSVLALDLSEVSAGTVSVGGDSIVFVDADDNGTKLESIADLVSGIASGTGIVASSGQLAVDGVLEDLDSLGPASADGEFIVATGAGAFAYESGNTARTSLGLGTGDSPQFTNLTVSGDLVVQGTTVTLDVATVGITGSFVFEGATADANETTLGVVDPTADRAIDLPDASGNLVVFSDASFQSAASAITLSELNILDGGTADSSVAIADTDQMIINDAGTMKQTAMSDLATYVGNNIAVNVQNVAAAGTLQVGVNYFSDMGSDGEDAVTLPASPSVGQSVKVKAPSDCSATRYITINRAGSQTIDGETSIRLESPFAAVELVYVASDLWRVF